jgi:hypothetical protein
MRNQSSFDRLFRGSLRKLPGTTASLDLIPTPAIGGHWENDHDGQRQATKIGSQATPQNHAFYGKKWKLKTSIILRRIPLAPRCGVRAGSGLEVKDDEVSFRSLVPGLGGASGGEDDLHVQLMLGSRTTD